MSTDRYNEYVHIFRGKGIENYRLRYAQGLEVNQTPYAFDLAQKYGFDAEFSSDGRYSLLARVIMKLFGLDIVHAYHNRRKIERSDVVWTMTENESLAIAALMHVGLVSRRPIVSSSVWVINEWDSIPVWHRRMIRRLSKFIDILTVQSKLCLDIAREAFPASSTKLMHFGINTEIFQITAPRLRVVDKDGPITIFAAGNDRTRDWHTLIAAFGGDDRFRLLIWCDWLDANLTAPHSNIIRLTQLSTVQFIHHFHSCDVCAVPMVDNIFSGITFALNAAALGAPMLCTRTGGIPTYFGEEDALFVPPGDAVAMRNAVLASTPGSRLALAQNAQRTFLDRDYSANAMIRFYATTTKALLARTK